jgi:hypothetical protein
MVNDDVRRAAQSLAAWVHLWGSMAVAARAWRELGPRLVRLGPTRSPVWWRLEPSIPAGLREAPPRPDPRGVLGAGWSDVEIAAEGAYREHQRERLRWLVESGRLTPREVEAARELLRLAKAAK